MRLTKFLIALNEYFSNHSFYDDEIEQTMVDGTEADCYNCLMQENEFHLLGKQTAEALIHLGFTNWEAFVVLLNKHNAVAD